MDILNRYRKVIIAEENLEGQFRQILSGKQEEGVYPE